MDHPLLMFAISLALLTLASGAGSMLRRIRDEATAEQLKGDLGVITSATLALMGLLTGFSFSMATSRYDLRMAREQREAVAIRTEYERADLVPRPGADQIKSLLLEYLDLRIRFYSTRSVGEAVPFEDAAHKLQDKLWNSILAPAEARPTTITGLVVSGMNEVINSEAETKATWINRIPTAAWAMLEGVGFCACLLTRYNASGRKFRLHLVLPLILSFAFFLIADIESPRQGIVLLEPSNLIILSRILRGQ